VRISKTKAPGTRSTRSGRLLERGRSLARALLPVGSVCIAVTVAACGGVEPTDEAGEVAREVPAEVVVEGLEIVLSDADTDLSNPAAIDVDGDGNIWVADQRLHHVLVISPDGEILRTVGRNGEGPGEFRAPRGVGIRGDRAYVLDNFHGVQSFDMEGNYVAAYPTPRVLSDFDFVGDGGLVASNNRVWTRGGLISALGPDGEERGLIGDLPFPDMSGFNFNDLRAQILEGTIPEALRNSALPVAAPDGSLWVVIHTESTLRRYGADGALLSETRFEIPELAAIEAQYYENFRDFPSADAFFFPTFAASGFANDDYLLLLWNTVEGASGMVTVHDDSGALVQRVLLPELDMGGGGFTPGSGLATLRMAVDAPRRRLYVSVSDRATIFGVDLPDTVRF